MTSQNDIYREDELKPASKISLNHYNHDIQFYGPEIPGNIYLDDLKQLGALRLLILEIVWELSTKCEDPTKCRQDLVFRLRSLGLKSFANLFDGSGCDIHDEERLCARWRDHVSHNAARLALSQKVEHHFWLQTAEDKLIEWRLTALNKKGIRAFMRIHKIQYPKVDHHEKEELKMCLTYLMDKPKKFNRTKFYKVPYSEVFGATEDRRLHLKSGIAYLTTSSLQFVIPHRFHDHLMKQITMSFHAENHQSHDPRVRDLISYLQDILECMGVTKWIIGTPDIKDLDEIAVKSYPPCMRKIHEALRKNHHLRNKGRVQYTLFLKSIGIPVEGTIEFYRNEFTQKMEDIHFDKEYTYYIRHLYGLVGAKRNYGMYNCTKIAETPAGDDEYHGCPFVQDDIEDLDRMFTRWKIPSTTTEQILNLTRRKKVSQACSTYFEETHRCKISCSVLNPMDFYTESRKYHRP